MDIVLSAFALLALSTGLVVTWGLVRLTSPGPGLFWSARVGRGGRIFWMPKFRTMRQDAPLAPREALSGGAGYETRLGVFLRRWSLDELPQLWSVLIGQMSLIGPRPLLADDEGTRTRWQFPGAFQTRPGMSGLAQIKGRNYVTPRRKARYDAFYARRAGLRFDLILIWLTVCIVFSGRGIS